MYMYNAETADAVLAGWDAHQIFQLIVGQGTSPPISPSGSLIGPTSFSGFAFLARGASLVFGGGQLLGHAHLRVGVIGLVGG